MRIHIDDNVVYLTVGNTYSLINKRENKPFATLEILAEDELRIVFYTIDGKVAHADRPGIGVEEIKEEPHPRVHPEPTIIQYKINDLMKQSRKLTKEGKVAEAVKLFNQAFDMQTKLSRNHLMKIWMPDSEEGEGDTNAT